MNRPEGISESAWKAAQPKAIDFVDWIGRHVVDEDCEHVLTTTIARAIQSAVEAERANAAKIVDFALDQYGRLSFVQTEGWIGLRKVVADRIRKGA